MFGERKRHPHAVATINFKRKMNMDMKSVAAAALTMFAAAGAPEDSAGFFSSSTAKEKKVEKTFTAFDQMRLDKAQAKRERKAAKRQLEMETA
jgi:hypothetical protein